MAESKSPTRQGERAAAEFSGATRVFAEQGADFARGATDKTMATAKETTRAAGEVYSALTGNTLDFHRQWIEMVRENTNAALDFLHRVLDVKSPSEFAELSAEHARKRFETFTEQARQLTGMAQKMTADLGAPMHMGMKNALHRAA